jgi:Cu2+-exporting ATPase
MTCCAASEETLVGSSAVRLRREELLRAGTLLPDGRMRYLFSAPAVRCGQCIATIERALARCPGVDAARVNLTLRRVALTLKGPGEDPCRPLDRLAELGYPATVLDAAGDNDPSSETAELLKATAVAGFGATNIMLLSVSVWSGADGAYRDLFHLMSGAIALPVAAYSGRPFFRSAFGAIRGGRLNMDVPISLGVLLTLGLSVFETFRGGQEVFFDAAAALLFFLLIGRYLDQLMRDRARSAVLGLTRLGAKGAMRVGADGALDYLALDEIAPGMTLRVAAGERVPVDARVLSGLTDLDRSLVSGESTPVQAAPGDEIEAGTLNLTGAIDIRALRPADASFLADVGRMLQAAEEGRGRYVRIADRAARLYSPVVHLLAAATFAGWMVATDGDWHRSLFVAISVLIITCPCALGLAVPIVHVVAAGRLFREGILMKDGSGLERLAEIDGAVFDKTGTLTTGAPTVAETDLEPGVPSALARELASHSVHPASRAVAEHLGAAGDRPVATIDAIREVPGQGIEGRSDGRVMRLGCAAWVAEIAEGSGAAHVGTTFAMEGARMARIGFRERLRTGAGAAVRSLAMRGIEPELLSGDADDPVTSVARQVGIVRTRAGASPADKIAHLEGLRDAGRKVLMVGDGLNDAPALAAAHVSMAPATAADVGRQAADFVFTRESLAAVPVAHAIAERAAGLVRQNFGLAILYNALAIPLAVAGLVTPLVAALAMSGSSILVVANALRLNVRSEPAPWLGAVVAPRVPA